MKQTHIFSVIAGETPFLTRIQRLHNCGNDALRALTAAEIEQLEHQSNVCSNWNTVRVRANFDPARVHQNYFAGRVVLGVFNASAESPHSGVVASTLIDCEVGDNAVVHRCPLISGYVIADGALVWASSLVFRGRSCFGNGVQISAGIETGGRDMALLAELDMPAVAEVLGNRADHALQSAYREAAERYSAACSAESGCVEAGARIENSRRVENSWIGAAARISGAERISNCSVLSSSDEPTHIGGGAIVEDSLVQHGARVDSQAIVQRSLIMEYATVERQAKVKQSVIGPNAVLGEGEISASCVGPFTGVQHQSLLIAAFWPTGRGILGAGANVGSNHTSRVADQEIWPAEGMFFGLDCVIKFPAEYRSAAYSVVASGVTTLPQRVSFPFSLIVEPHEVIEGVSPSFNRLIPAWGLRRNLYALLRNQLKYQRRNRARRHRFDFGFLRDDIVAMMTEAMPRLESITSPQRYYLEEQIEGIGANVVFEKDRVEAIKTYGYFIDYARCLERAQQMQQRLVCDAEPILPQDLADRDLLLRLRQMNLDFEQSVTAARERDSARGSRIIGDYSLTHPCLEDDDVVRHCAAETERHNAEIAELLRYLDNSGC